MSYRYFLKIAYDGYDYFGFQKQKSKKTIELELKNALYIITKKDINIVCQGRTDRQVHALYQVCHVDIDFLIKEYSFKKALNNLLPSDIIIIDVIRSNLHARFDTIKKEYKYIITKEKNITNYRYKYYCNNIDEKLLLESTKLLIKKADFKGFASSQLPKNKPTIKEIFDIKVNFYKNDIELYFIGDGFLKYQVRKMVGILLDISLHKKEISIINKIFETNDTRLTNNLAPGYGLYLNKVYYKEDIFNEGW